MAKQSGGKPQIDEDFMKEIISFGRHAEHPVFQQKIVIIFDECHRSQFGDMHTAIIRKFVKCSERKTS